jgi:hypothetical protein
VFLYLSPNTSKRCDDLATPNSPVYCSCQVVPDSAS